jgi:hypothetical protein
MNEMQGSDLGLQDRIHIYNEDSIGMPSAEFWENKAGLSRDFLTRRYAFLRCFRPVFLFVGHGVGQLEISVRQGIPAIPT